MSLDNVNYREKQANSKIFKLTDVVTNESVALIPCDSAGNFSWTGITRVPIQKNAIQTTNQGGEWSDLEYPFMAIQQEDWTGGRGNDRFSGDTSRFYDSRRGQTAFNSCIYCGPLEYYSYGFKPFHVTNCPASLTWIKLKGVNSHIIREIAVTSSNDYGNIYVHLRRRGTPDSGLTVRLRDNMSSHPTILASHTYTTDEVTDTTAEFYKFSFEALTLSGTVYLEVFTDSGDTENYWEIGCTKQNTMLTRHSSSGLNWDYYDYDLLFRLDTVQEDVRDMFFTYHQLIFMVRQEPQDNPALWLNGDIGVTTSFGYNTISDSTKSWVANCYKGARVGLIYKHGAEGHVSVWRTITGNTSNTLTVDSNWDIVPDEDTIFIINDTPLWQEITGHGLTAYVTDIHVIRDVVYFAQGDYVNVRKMRFNRDDSAFEWIELPGITATFLQSVRDREGMMLYRARNDDEMHQRSIERSDLLDWDIIDEDAAEVEGEIESSLLDHTIIEKDTESVTSSGNAHATSSYDNTEADYDKKRYKIIVETYSNAKMDGYSQIMLQESKDNETWFDVESINVTSTGIWYLTAHCDYRYRRFKVTSVGTSTSISNITYKTTQVPQFEDRNTLLDNYGKITRIFEYGAEQEKSLWVFQEGMVSSVNKTEGNSTSKSQRTYHLDRINLDEMRTTAEEWNGKATETNHVYLLWAWLNGLQRYYNTELEGKGPDHDEGMPPDMRGRVTRILSYPSNFFISIDGGDEGYSSIMQFNGNGWHNLYRAPNKGERIYDMEFQPIYGDRPDRLWAQVGDNVIWLAMPSKILYAIQDPHAEYTHEGIVVSAWITGGMAEVEKLWQSLSIMADYLDGVNCWVEADYQLDDEEIWHPIPYNPYDTSPQQEEDFARDNESVNGKKLRYRLRLQTTDIHMTPKVNVVLIKAIGRIDIKYSYGFHFRNIKYKEDLSSSYEEVEPYELQSILDDWANRLCTLRLNSAYKIFDNKKVFIDGTTTSVLQEKNEGYLSQITLTEI